MRKIEAKEYSYNIIKQNGSCKHPPFPYFRDDNGDKCMYSVSPQHGRSYLIKKENEHYIISKGNGFSYTAYNLLNTNEFSDHIWGLLLKEAAIRDFLIGGEIQSLGIKTNTMEYVLQLKKDLYVHNTVIKPYLLQYTVESPYRLSDFPFMSLEQIRRETDKWEYFNYKKYPKKHLIAAEILIKNLHILHTRKILHNAIHLQNYTWALELLDFELARTPQYPYPNEEDEKLFPILYNREIIQTYEIIYNIATFLNEKVVDEDIESIFYEYDFNISQFVI